MIQLSRPCHLRQDAAGDGHVVRKGTAVKLEAPVKADADNRLTLRDVVNFYHHTMKESHGLTLPEWNRKAESCPDSADDAMLARGGRGPYEDCDQKSRPQHYVVGAIRQRRL